jgi:putative aldouronate transport system permease protein
MSFKQGKYFGKFNLFDIFNYMILSIIGFICVYPFIYVFTISLLPKEIYAKGGLFLYPKEISLEAYKYIFKNSGLGHAFYSSVVITVTGTILTLLLTSLCAYALSKTNLKGYKFFINVFIFTMYFSGGLIPSYMLMRSLNLIDTYWSVTLTGTVSVYFALVLRSFFMNLPESLEEAAIIDGASEVQIFLKIILPLSIPVMAALSLFFAVDRWNMFFTPLIYLNSRKMWPIQVILKEMIFDNSDSILKGVYSVQERRIAQSYTLKMAIIVIAILPIAIVYPFLQKYFAKGILIGAVKA